MRDLLDEIVGKLKSNYGGHLMCDEQRADLFVYVGGNEVNIVSISTDTIYFENDYSVKLIDSDIQHLVYINSVI